MTSCSLDRTGLVFLALVGLATAGAIVAGDGQPLLSVLPVFLIGLAFAVLKLPVRWSATALIFLVLALDNPHHAEGLWISPLGGLGDLLDAGASRLLRVPVSGLEIVGVTLLVVAAWQGREAAHVSVPRATWTLLAAYVGGVLFAEVVGLARGLGPAPWKLRYLLHGPWFFVLFHVAYRNPADFRLLGRAIVVAAQVKGILALWVQLVVAPALTGGRLATATTHGDSVLFAMAVLVLVIAALERPGVLTALRAAALSVIPFLGIHFNNRRLAWGLLAMSLMAVFVISPWRAWKRALVKGLLIGAPVVIAYISAGWNHVGGGILGPVAKLRTMTDSKDASTYWREVEAWNVATTIRSVSILGTGLDGEYVETMANDSIAESYPEYREWPHNTVLGLLLYAGLPGFTAIWLLYLGTVFFAVRAYRHARRPEERVAAMSCVVAIVCVCGMAWGDTGAHFKQYNIVFGAALALAGKLAIATGAWQAEGRCSTAVRSTSLPFGVGVTPPRR
jgi:hypothetical protein